MSDDSAKLIDGAAQAAVEAALRRRQEIISMQSYLAIWVDPKTDVLEFENDHLRAGVLLEMQDDEPQVFAIYEMVSGDWRFASGSKGVNHAALLAEFSASRNVAAQYSQHPTRRLCRPVQPAQVAEAAQVAA